MQSLLSKYINPFFLFPFLLWVMFGAFVLFQYDSKTIFIWINGHYSDTLNFVFSTINYLGEGWLIAILSFLFFLYRPLRNKWFFITIILCTLLPALLTQLIKYNVETPRPMNRFDSAAWIHFLPNWDLLHNNSFPSGHSTGAFSLMTCLAAVMPNHLRKFGLLFFLLAFFAAYARVYLTAHFFLDIYVGSIIGAMFSLLITLGIGALQQYQSEKSNSVSL